MRWVLSAGAGLGATLLLYAMFYNRFLIRPDHGDPRLAFSMLPAEVLLGVAVGFAVFRLSRSATKPSGTARERMVLRLMYRNGGTLRLGDPKSILNDTELQDILSRLEQEGKVCVCEGGYRLT